uniref:PeaG n=1 Tax=Pseudomonas putida TaxID=303 RepID=B1N7H7_PSEPU|nr:PeaG [Pseudomonas putida]
MRGSGMAGTPSLRAGKRCIAAQPVINLLAVHPRLLTHQRRDPAAQGCATQTRARPAACPDITAKICLPGAQPGPLAGRATGIPGNPEHPGVSGRVHRLTLRRAGCTQQHASRQRFGTGLVQHRPVLLQPQAEVDQRGPCLHQPQQPGRHLQGAGAGLATKHLGHQQRYRAGLALQAGKHRTAMSKLVRPYFSFTQLAVFQPETAGTQQTVGLLRRAATVEDANAHVRAHA